MSHNPEVDNGKKDRGTRRNFWTAALLLPFLWVTLAGAAAPESPPTQVEVVDYNMRRAAPSNPGAIGFGLPHPQDTQHGAMLTAIDPELPLAIKSRHDLWVSEMQADPSKYNGGYVFKIIVGESFSLSGRVFSRGEEIIGTYLDEHRGPRTGVMTYVERQEFNTEEEFQKYIADSRARSSAGTSILDGVQWEGPGKYMTKAFRFENNTGDGSYGINRIQASLVDPYAYLRAADEAQKRAALANFNPASIGLPESVKEQVVTRLQFEQITFSSANQLVGP